MGEGEGVRAMNKINLTPAPTVLVHDWELFVLGLAQVLQQSWP